MFEHVTKEKQNEIVENPKVIESNGNRKYFYDGTKYFGLDNTILDARMEEFDNLKSCERWLNGEPAEIARISKKEINFPFTDGVDKYFVYQITTEKELLLIEEYYQSLGDDNFVKFKYINRYPEWVIIMEADDGYCYSYDTISNITKDYKTILEDLGIAL